MPFSFTFSSPRSNLASPIKTFYKGKNVFITGATGFVGVTILEKLLRDIPEIGTVYLLMRPKKGKTVAQQLKIDEKRFDKIVPIEGDVGQEHLGISEAERQVLIDNVHVVFHSAATLDFFQSLKETTNINLLGTRRVVELCKQLSKLEVSEDSFHTLVHVSSAYVNSYITEVEEKLYPAPDDPEKVIHLAETLSDEALKELEPNHRCLETTHTRWTISKNGPQGFFMGASRGILRRLPLDPTIIMDYIPVDVVVNAIITTGYYVTRSSKVKNAGKPADLQIFHLTSSTYKPFRFEFLINKINAYLHEYPLVPKSKLVKSLFIFRLGAILFHFIPGFFLDLVTN
ncbi:unnamed protein product [Ceratitis capitata]|uniref:Fatty acyl-CoA reductase n=1 Tax=Ceratitis capitata TaxID=7213 RepID=A0A811V8M1_CERCA|nr:unnamed protein product [Ceratitis capitata]